MGALGRRGAVLAACLCATVAVFATVWALTFANALDPLDKRAQADLTQAADRLIGHLQRMRDLAVLLADHPDLLSLTAGAPAGAGADDLLQRFADRTGADRIWLADKAGRVIAASDGAAGRSLSGTAAFERALDGALGSALRVTDTARTYITAAPVFASEGPVLGAVTVEVGLAQFEWNWPAGPSPVYFTDATGRVVVSNRSDLIGTSHDPAAQAPFPRDAVRTLRGHTLWTLQETPYLPRRALHLHRDLNVIGMGAEILVDVTPALRLATLQAMVAAALCLFTGLLLIHFSDRRRALAGRLRIEETANAALEARVAERTAELQTVNVELRREIGERREAEAALKRAQADLVQAGKLSALGQMSAGISHELNQPLTAIQSFAENGAVYLDRGQPDKAAENLSRIGELARRMARIIRNLRAFARQERVEMSDVDLGAVVDAALEIAAARIRSENVTVTWTRPPVPILVRGGEVRLQQVILNLVGNAIDAMAASDPKALTITVDPGDPVLLSVQDTGPGIADPKKIFDPFYSTKEVGAAEGMGLGLSISYGLVQSFGGAIRGRNAEDGGAIFTVELAPVAAKAAA